MVFLHKYTFHTSVGRWPPRPVLLLRAKKSFHRVTETFSAVRTRLELVTPCVTGMYSNQLN